ncbi:MAG: hypothetical protein HQK54_07310 [Oligoflexales bacterium]|nr:hypothetical protein [Oligoflexales bacterium]
MNFQISKNILKKIRRNIFSREQGAYVTYACSFGNQTVSELQQITGSLFSKGKFSPRILFNDGLIGIKSIDMRSLCEIVFRLKTAKDVYLVLDEAHVGGPKDLIRRMGKIPYELIFNPGSSISVKAYSSDSILYHEGLIKELIGKELAGAGFHDNAPFDHFLRARLKKNHFTLEIALGGTPLYKRGYKKSLKTPAPLAEHAAASLIRESFDWMETEIIPNRIFIPFSGGGTLGFETISYLADIPLFTWGRNFSMEELVCYPKSSMNNSVKKMTVELKGRLERISQVKTLFMDIQEDRIKETHMNIEGFESALQKTAGIGYDGFSVVHGDIFSTSVADWFYEGRDVFVPLNPPYGIRLSGEKGISPAFYGRVASVISGLLNMDLKKVFGFCLLPDEKAKKCFLKKLAGFSVRDEKITLGGRSLLAVYFKTCRNQPVSPASCGSGR